MGGEIEHDNYSWCERILKVMQKDKWYSHKTLLIEIGINLNDHRQLVKSFGSYLFRLTKNGFIIRAYAPDALKRHNGLNDIKYVYKRTNKIFKPTTEYHVFSLRTGMKRRNKQLEQENDD